MDPCKDLGIFGTVTPEIFEEMARYAGTYSLCRNPVEVCVENLNGYDFEKFPATINGAIEWFLAARRKTPQEYLTELQVSLKHESYDEGGAAELKVYYIRLETDGEMKIRFDKYMHYINSKELNERAQFERLKRKFVSEVEAKLARWE